MGPFISSMFKSSMANRLLGYFVSDFLGMLSVDVGYDIHIKCHHPHTNIIGLGDSSTWKVPFLPKPSQFKQDSVHLLSLFDTGFDEIKSSDRKSRRRPIKYRDQQWRVTFVFQRFDNVVLDGQIGIFEKITRNIRIKIPTSLLFPPCLCLPPLWWVRSL